MLADVKYRKSQAGLHDLQTGQSSLLWAQDTAAQASFREGDWSWQRLRDLYYRALTSGIPEERSAYFAQTFRGLGHQMHLLQDATQPDHVRNDAHPEDSTLKHKWFGSKYTEWWAKNNQGYINALATQPVFPHVDLSVSPRGLTPIAQFLDTDQYNGSNPSAALTQGIAEYTNANFFSDHTLFAAEEYLADHRHYFPYPKRSSTNLQDYVDQQLLPETIVAEDGGIDVTFWIAKTGGGERIAHFVRPSYLARELAQASGPEGPGNVLKLYQRSFYLDEECLAEYAQKLIPRAVGYSAALVHYFFRGQLTLEQEAGGQARFVIENHTDESMHGTFELYYDNTEQGRVQAWSGALTLGAQGRSQAFTLTAPENTQHPGEYVLVFRGKLGAEEGAVVGVLVRVLTTVRGTLLDHERRTIANVPVLVVAGEEPHCYQVTAWTDTDGAFVMEGFPADRGAIHIEVWSPCSLCSQVREGPGSMIPREQLIFEYGVSFVNYLDQTRDYGRFPVGFPLMYYRATSAEKAPIVDHEVDFGQIPVAYVSVVYEQVTVPGTRGGPMGIWGSFRGEIYYSPGTQVPVSHLYEPYWGYWYAESAISGQAQCSADHFELSTRTWTYRDEIWDMRWLQIPTLVTGRIVPHVDDAAGQVIGTIDMEFEYHVSGYYHAVDETNVACYCVGPHCQFKALMAHVQKSGVKAMIKVYE